MGTDSCLLKSSHGKHLTEYGIRNICLVFAAEYRNLMRNTFGIVVNPEITGCSTHSIPSRGFYQDDPGNLAAYDTGPGEAELVKGGEAPLFTGHIRNTGMEIKVSSSQEWDGRFDRTLINSSLGLIFNTDDRQKVVKL